MFKKMKTYRIQIILRKSGILLEAIIRSIRIILTGNSKKIFKNINKIKLYPKLNN